MSEYELNLYKRVGIELKKIRLEKGLTRKDVVANVNITERSLIRYEQGERAMDTEIIIELCTYYNYDYKKLLTQVNIDSLNSISKDIYVDEESMKIAREIASNEDYKTLFDMSKKIPPERLKAHIAFMRDLYKKLDD